MGGVPLDDIRRFGRRKSIAFHRYIHHDALIYHGLSRHIARTEGFLEQLKQTNAAAKAARIDESEERAEFRTGVANREKITSLQDSEQAGIVPSDLRVIRRTLITGT